MPSFNHITLLGHCTRDPELRYAKSGIPICSLGLAVNHVTGTGDTRKEDVCFVDITCFNRLAEIAAEYLAKGAQVLVAGRLTYQTWETQDGQKRSKHTVVAEQLQFMGKAQTATPDTEPVTASEAPRRTPPPPRQPVPARAATGPVPPVDDEDDIPFIRGDSEDGVQQMRGERHKFRA